MKTMTCLFIFGFVILLGAPRAILADVSNSAAKEAAVLPDDGSGITKVAIQFDLSSLRQGENRHIEEALLDWWVTGLGAEETSRFEVHSIETGWTRASVQSGSALSMEETKAADWQVNTSAPETAVGRLVRLDLTDLVGAWASGAKANCGVIVTTQSLDGKTLADQLGKAKLIIRYGFRDN